MESLQLGFGRVLTLKWDFTEVLSNDPSLLKKHTQTISVTTDEFTYPEVRVFYRPHPKAEMLPPKLPLIVFLHGVCRWGGVRGIWS